MWTEYYSQVEELGVLPVAVLDNVSQALPLADALSEGGLPAIEITFRTAVAADCIKKVSSERPNVLVGAGTVLSVDQVTEAVEAGAKFIVSPGFDEAVVLRCIEEGIPVVPGAVTPTEIIAARNYGLTLTKFFPAGQFGGVDAISALAAPFNGHMFMPTGGVNSKNLVGYLSSSHVSCCGGTWLARKALLAENNYDEIRRLCRKAVGIVHATHA